MSGKSLLIILGLPLVLFSCKTAQETDGRVGSNQTEQVMLNSQYEKVSYGIGLNIANNLRNEGIDSIDVELLARAISDVYQNREKLMSNEDANQAIQQYFQEAQSRQQGANKREGEEFLAKNRDRPEVTQTESGLQYEVIEEGKGERPSAEDRVTVHYHGTLIDGTVFDSSIERGEPATFPVNGVIAGWVEALQLMREGAKWRLYIPSHLAYGERGAGGSIGPGATLIFDVELISIVK